MNKILALIVTCGVTGVGYAQTTEQLVTFSGKKFPITMAPLLVDDEIKNIKVSKIGFEATNTGGCGKGRVLFQNQFNFRKLPKTLLKDIYYPFKTNNLEISRSIEPTALSFSHEGSDFYTQIIDKKNHYGCNLRLNQLFKAHGYLIEVTNTLGKKQFGLVIKEIIAQ